MEEQKSRALDETEKQKKKTGKTRIVIAVILAIAVLAGGGFLMYQKVFKATEIDLTSIMTEPEFTGVSEVAKLKDPIIVDQKKADKLIKSIDNEKRAEEAKKLIKSVTYEVDKDSELSNGDEITVTAKYDKSIEENSKLKVVKVQKKVKVEKLAEELTSADIKNSGILNTLSAEADRFVSGYIPYQWLYCKTEKGNIIAGIGYMDIEAEEDVERMWYVVNSSTFTKSLDGVRLDTWEILGQALCESYEEAYQKVKSVSRSVEVIQ